jgi:hypothetical protein
VTVRQKTAHGLLLHPYRSAAQLPLRAPADTLQVNWCGLSSTTAQGECLDHNAFVTQEKSTQKTVAQVVTAGRTRWKVENENNPTLKTKGYHLAHNFGHGKQHLASLLATCNLLAFLLHTRLDLQEVKYRVLRRTLGRRQTFFDDLRALTRYLCFARWGALLDFMLDGLEIESPPDSS